MKTTILILLAGIVLFRTGLCDESREPVLVGYLPEYRVDGWSPRPGMPLTDLVYFGLVLKSGGTVNAASIKPQVVERMLAWKKEHGFRLLVCVGGWDRSEGFREATATRESRARLISELAKLCETNGFDGVDYDWEHPQGIEEHANYAALVRETREKFAPQKRLVTMAIAGWIDLPKEAYEHVDRVHLMSYDQPFPQATLKALEEDVARLQRQGCPAAKIAAGVPFYGRNARREARTYAELLKSPPGAADSEDQRDGYAFNGPATLRRKLEFVRREGLAGVMVWEVAQDAAEAEHSLLKLLGDGLRSNGRLSKGRPTSSDANDLQSRQGR